MHARFLRSEIAAALEDTRVVLISGPRQSGKTTLAKQISDSSRPYLTLDDNGTRSAALADPTGFIRRLDRAIIDEIQRVPDLLLPIKIAVDEDPRLGRFLLTGSADLLTLPQVADSLAGRMQVDLLLPLGGAELDARPNPTDLLQSLFEGGPFAQGAPRLDRELEARVLTGGYPEAVARSKWTRRRRWHTEYVNSIVERDVLDIAEVEYLDEMPRLLAAAGLHAGQLLNTTKLGRELSLSHATVKRYLTILKQLYLVYLLPPWSTNRLKRLAKTPKLHFLDSGLLASLVGLSPEAVERDRTHFGPVLETYVLAELLKYSDWFETEYSFLHLRGHDGQEIDFIVEDRRQRLIAIEVKASATVTAADFRHLRWFADAYPDRFVGGYVFYDHTQVLPFGDKMWALPLSTLWA